MKSATEREGIFNQPTASAFLVSATINGALALLVLVVGAVLCLVPIPWDVARSTIGSLLSVPLFLGPLAFFHYGKYRALRKSDR